MIRMQLHAINGSLVQKFQEQISFRDSLPLKLQKVLVHIKLTNH